MKMEETECSETSVYKIQTPGNYPEGNIQHTEHGESLESRILKVLYRERDLLQFITYTQLALTLLLYSFFWV